MFLNKLFYPVVALGLGPLCKMFGGPFFMWSMQNLPVPSMRKCYDSDMFRVHQYTNWCQWFKPGIGMDWLNSLGAAAVLVMF